MTELILFLVFPFAYIIYLLRKIMSAIDNATAAVTAQTDVVTSVVTLLTSIAAELNAASNDPKIQAIADKITANSKIMADAVIANTEPTPPAPAAP